MKRISTLLLVCLVLGGCVTSLGRQSLKGLNSTPYCSSQHMKKVAMLDYFVSSLAVGGMTYQNVKEAVGEPDSYRVLDLTNGASVEVWAYVAKNRHCRGLDDRNDIPIVFQNGQLIGAGEDYFDRHINGQVRSVYNVKHFNQRGISTGDVVKEVLFAPLDYLF